MYFILLNMGCNELADCLLEKVGIDIGCFGKSFIARNVETRLRHLQLSSEADYLNVLQHSDTEAHILLDLFQVNYSEFFRNPFTFSMIEHVLMPGWFAETSRQRRREIRFWSAACASGQEPYSLAMIYDSVSKARGSQTGCRIFATDMSANAIASAKEGIYNAQSLANVPLKRLNEFFHKAGDDYRISPALKDYIDFSVFDILSPHAGCPPAIIYGGFDAVFCANLLFYYNAECQGRILGRVRQCLVPGGVLITGEVERDILKAAGMIELIEGSCIFR